MKALDEYFLMVMFTLLLNTVHVLAICKFNLDKKNGIKRGGIIRDQLLTFSQGSNKKMGSPTVLSLN